MERLLDALEQIAEQGEEAAVKVRKTVMVDIDGTLANVLHRAEYLRQNSKDWVAFNEMLADDTPYEDIIELVKLYKGAGYRIVVVTARGEETRVNTAVQLRKFGLVEGVDYEAMFMRAAGDNRKDNIIKEEILDKLIGLGYNPTIAIEDRNRVVEMWRKRGIRCLQVQAGDF